MKKNRERLLIGALIIEIVVVIAISNNAGAQKNNFPIDKEASCITASCHADIGKKKKFVHAVGVNTKFCNKCHEIVEEGIHSFKELPSDTSILCAQCHSEEFPTPTEFEKIPPKVIFSVKDNLHDPFGKGKCTECHDAHGSNFFKHLKTEYPNEFYAPYSDEVYSLCFNAECHKGLENAFTKPRTLTHTKFRNGNLNLHFRHVNKVKGRTCRACHHHHNAKNPQLIRQYFRFRKRLLSIEYEKTETGGNCAPSCHMPVEYDRYKPVKILMRTTPRLGKDATSEELELIRKKDMEEQKAKLQKSEYK